MESSGEDAYVPGISAPGNKRPSRVKARKTKEVKPIIPHSQPIVEDVQSSADDDVVAKQQLKRSKVRRSKPRQVMPVREAVNVSHDSEKSDLMTGTIESFAERSIRRLNQASASLKDLRPEDKQRVANLIKELAKVGEEKEKVVKELHGEREYHEKQVLTLVEQQEKILSEREEIQEKLFQCQQLLTEYQNQLLNKQDELHSSIAGIQQQIKEPAPLSKAQHCHLVREGSQQNDPKVLAVGEVSSMGLERDLTAVLDMTPILPVFLPQDQRVSRPREGKSSNKLPSTRDSRVYNGFGEKDDPVTDLLLRTKTPEDNVKRPYTSLIDKEIARERSLSRSSRGSEGSNGSRSRSVSPADGRPRFTYPPTLNGGVGPLNEPMASSTHKSMEIKQNLPDHDLDSPRSSLRGCSIRGQSPSDIVAQQGHQSRVVFNEKTENSDGAQMHSPNLRNHKMFNDPNYADFYKKLSPAGRKRELLKQRQALLDEQERLRLVLEKQEKALKLRQYEYEKREELQRERMEFYKEGGKFPALRLDFDGDSEVGGANVNVNIVVEELNAGKEGVASRKGGAMEVERTTTPNMEIVVRRKITVITDVYDSDGEETVQVRSRVSANTSPIVTPRAQKISIATSPSLPDEDYTTPRFVDAATSVSYRTPLKDASNRQGNLPLQSNRQKTSPYTKQPIRAKQEEVMTHIPGEKTLNVLELVNSMEERPPSLNNSFSRPADIENKPMSTTRQTTPGKYSNGSQRSSHRQYGSSQLVQGPSHGNKMEDKEVSMEENKILEDIFFLK